MAGRLAETLARRQERSLAEGRVYLMVEADGKKLAGNLYAWPSEASLAFDGKVHGAWFEENVIPAELSDDDAWWPVIAREYSDGSRLLLARGVPQDEAVPRSPSTCLPS
jgi:hypothetical protein